MSKTTDDQPEVVNIRIASYPGRWKPLEQRIEALRIFLKHSGFRPLSIEREGNSNG